MRHRRDQMAVYRVMKDRMNRDKAKTQVLQISSVGLMEMTRQRLNESLQETLSEPCEYCEGRGRVKTSFTLSVEIQRALNTVIARHQEEAGDLVVIVHPVVLERFKKEDSHILMDLERKHTGRLTTASCFGLKPQVPLKRMVLESGPFSHRVLHLAPFQFK